MFKSSHFAAILCLTAVLASCNSQSQLTAARSGPAAGQVAVTQSTTSLNGSTPQVAYSFSAASLPASIKQGSNLALVLGGEPSPLTTQGPNLVAYLPPQTQPPVPDSSGNVPLLVQSSAGSLIIIAHVTATKPVILGPSVSPTP